MCSYPVSPDVLILSCDFTYFHTLCMQALKALERLHICAVSPEPSLLAYGISAKISVADSYILPEEAEWINLCVPKENIVQITKLL